MQTIKLTQRALIEALRVSCYKHGADDNATIYFTEESGVITTQHFEGENPTPADEHPNNAQGH